MESEPPIRLGYPSVPVPTRAMQALAAGRLKPDDFALVCFLFCRASFRALERRGESPSLTLTQLAEGIGFLGEQRTLSKRLRRLRDRPERWFSYRVQGGRGRYVFVLHPDAPEVFGPSHPGPTSQASDRPTSDCAEAVLETGFPSTSVLAPSDLVDDLRPTACPTSPESCPSSEHATDGLHSAIETDRTAEPVPPAQTSQRKPNHSLRDDLERDLLGTTRTGEEIRWPDTTGLSAEEATLADCDAIVLAGHAYWTEDELERLHSIPDPNGNDDDDDSTERLAPRVPFRSERFLSRREVST